LNPAIRPNSARLFCGYDTTERASAWDSEKWKRGVRLFSLQKVQRAGQLDEMMDRYAGILRFLPASSCILREVVVILFGSIILL
jgi:hypothetical protein